MNPDVHSPEIGLEAGEDRDIPLAVTGETFDCRKAFAEELLALARSDERVVVVCNDSVGSSNLVQFREEFPDRLINVGIAEQDLVGVGAGLANGGMIPFVSAAAPFLTGRALEQIKADVAYSDTHVVLCGQSPGMAYGELGPTHHSIEDFSWIRAVAGLPIAVPADPDQTRAAVLAVGTLVSRALVAAQSLAAEGIGVRVLNMTFVHPLDDDAVLRAGRETRGVVTAEEATVSGGLGAAVASLLAERHPTPMRILGVRDAFAPTGDAAFLLDHFGLSADGIVAAVREVLAHG